MKNKKTLHQSKLHQENDKKMQAHSLKIQIQTLQERKLLPVKLRHPKREKLLRAEKTPLVKV